MRTSPTFRRSAERTDMHKTETVTVLPGVRFAYVGTEDYKNASFAVGFKYKTKRGASSCDLILSRLLFRTSADYPDNRRFSRKLEELYATDLSVQTVRFGDFRASVFQANFLDDPFAVEIPDFTRAVLSFVAGAILSPASDENGLFPFEETEREKRALLDRIRGIRNSKTAYAHARLSELTSDPRFYDVPDYGTEAEAEGVTPDALRKRYRAMLYRSEICFVYAGSRPMESVLSLVRELFEKILVPRAPLSGRPRMPRRAPHSPALFVREETDGEQAMLGLAYRMPTGFAEKGSECVPMLLAVLSDAPMSLLFSEVREKGGFCYSIRALAKPSERKLFVLCGIAPGTERRVEHAVSRVLSRIRAGRIDASLLFAALSYVKMTLTTVFESVEETVGFVLFRLLFDRRIDPDELASDAERVTAETLSEYMKRVKPDAVYLLTPKGEVENG